MWTVKALVIPSPICCDRHNQCILSCGNSSRASPSMKSMWWRLGLVFHRWSSSADRMILSMESSARQLHLFHTVCAGWWNAWWVRWLGWQMAEREKWPRTGGVRGDHLVVVQRQYLFALLSGSRIGEEQWVMILIFSAWMEEIDWHQILYWLVGLNFWAAKYGVGDHSIFNEWSRRRRRWMQY